MKTLLLIRHGKSSWKDPALTDLQRPLKKRGIRNAREMGERLGKLEHGVERVFTSPARRTVETLELMAEAAGFGAESSEVVADFYSFDYDDLMVAIGKTDDRWQSVAVVGHNPAITDLVNFLALEHLINIPTCGVALLKLDIRRWNDLRAGCAKLEHYDYPKNDPDSED
ncbi:MAG: histidine phosphatase family protein [Porticoccaceae bacterium]|nr:histidine phosphatase family protein [Porticoccaceae bacterium]